MDPGLLVPLLVAAQAASNGCQQVAFQHTFWTDNGPPLFLAGLAVLSVLVVRTLSVRHHRRFPDSVGAKEARERRGLARWVLGG